MVDLSLAKNRFDPVILQLIPHRPPMLLINRVESLDQTSSSAFVFIDSQAPFYEANLGVPSWIGLEYMGQTAALIAGFQLREGLAKPHLGLLLGTRSYTANSTYFTPNTKLLVECSQLAVVGESLITFDCTIRDYPSGQQQAQASLSVFRKPY
ncbi:MAG: putative hotdog family 3-hydroxylacyl-ACP dehydratase [Dinoroseobacter sp.]|jgi:predicted hotdog family 3-hydroxylacyl-ACP dehydratase